MTELERARAHLRDVQLLLVNARMEGFPFRAMQVCEETVLAALSWLWDEQQKEVTWLNADFVAFRKERIARLA